jgi:Pyruvate phosphate dikinase, AMP/ATP-binding domain/PEP-utilising enzyme, mobile domain
MPTTAVTKGKTVSTDREEPHTDTIFTVPLEQLGRDDLDWAGGKGANLGELVKARFLVPKGFVVTTDAYDDFVAHNRLDEAITVMLRDEQGSEARAIGSHAAIVAREYGIPAVMGTGTAPTSCQTASMCASTATVAWSSPRPCRRPNARSSRARGCHERRGRA